MGVNIYDHVLFFKPEYCPMLSPFAGKLHFLDSCCRLSAESEALNPQAEP
jgi:hypothetical protein